MGSIKYNLLLLVLPACGIYSFRGDTLPSDVRTLMVQNFPNQAPLTVPTLSQTFTEALRNKFLAQAPLTLTNQNPDLILSGYIENYAVTPVAIQSGDQAAQNRMTLTVYAECQSPKYPQLNWKQSFSNFLDFPANTPISTVQENLLSELSNRISQDIVNKTLSNW
ncbi:MAG: LPS assembly lipoprotein LptE [Bacteroidia bacterium]